MMDHKKTQSVSLGKTVKQTNCYLWAIEQRRKRGGRVFFRWTVNHRFMFFRWFHALHLDFKYDHLVETKFSWQKYWSIGCSHWKGIPFPRVYWFSEQHAGYLQQAIPQEEIGRVWIPPLIFNAIIKEGDKSRSIVPNSMSQKEFGTEGQCV